jgi:hypothetical protein
MAGKSPVECEQHGGLKMKATANFYRQVSDGEIDFWEATRRTLEDWFDLQIQEDPALCQVRIARAEAFLGYELPGSVKKFMGLMVGIENSDPNFICLDMKPHYSEVTSHSGDFLCLCKINDTEDIRYGIPRRAETASDHDVQEASERIYCLDFDREEIDLNEDDPEDSVEEPEVECFAGSPEQFVLRLLVGQFSSLSSAPLHLSGELEDESPESVKRIEESLENSLGAKISLPGWDLWSAPGVLVAKYFSMGEWIDIVAHDREGALKIDGLVLENIGFGRAAVEKHSFD